MKVFVTIVLWFMISTSFAQQMNSDQWNEEAKTNIRLLPKYGHAIKSEGQKESDRLLIEDLLKKDSTRRKASDHLIELGFKYLYRDLKTAMYRFNQAYLLDSTNTDIYWGFAAVYMTLGEYGNAQKQYTLGLDIEPNNTHLLTDYGTYFMAQSYALEPVSAKDAAANLDSAISYLLRSYTLDQTNENTSFKLSVSYWKRSDCENAWKYYDICKNLGGQLITDDYTKDLKKKCSKRN